MQDTPQDAHWGKSSVSDPDYQREQREKNERARRLVDEAHLAAPDGQARADRELLELAAKAAGLEIRASQTPLHDASQADDYFEVLTPYGWRPWGPLKDDGDALRLAVKLRLRISVYGDGAEVCENVPGEGWAVRGWSLLSEGAARRAIVRAAAAIGKASP